jgi:hypothetical protein
VSARAGDRLDESLFRRLSGAPGAAPEGEAILAATVDDRGRPHPALLTYGDVLALTPALLRLAVSASGATQRNLVERGAVTLAVIGPAGVAYVKAAARPLDAEASLAGAGLAAFEARIEEVRVDHPRAEEQARLTSGITFTTAAAGTAREWTARHEALRRARPA